MFFNLLIILHVFLIVSGGTAIVSAICAFVLDSGWVDIPWIASEAAAADTAWWVFGTSGIIALAVLVVEIGFVVTGAIKDRF